MYEEVKAWLFTILCLTYQLASVNDSLHENLAFYIESRQFLWSKFNHPQTIAVYHGNKSKLFSWIRAHLIVFGIIGKTRRLKTKGEAGSSILLHMF